MVSQKLKYNFKEQQLSIMKRYLWAILAIALTITGCRQQENKKDNATDNMVTTTIEGRFVGSGVESISLERLSDNFLDIERVDNCKLTANGDFSFEIEVKQDSSPRFYQITTGDDNYPIVLVVAPGDKITLQSAGDIFRNYRVSGSKESQLIQEFNVNYFEAYDNFMEYVNKEDNSEALATATKAMRQQTEFIISNSSHLAAIYALNLRLFESHIPLMASKGINCYHYQAVRDAIAKSYPNSPYIETLNRSIELAMMISTAPEALYPNITLSDINRNVHSLSEFQGKVTLLCFWSAQDQISSLFIGEFKDIYERYHDAGLEAYFVSTDSSRIYWIDTVQQQQHPWVSVFGGDNPTVFSTYNVNEVPLAFIIDRQGNMSNAPLTPNELEARIKELL